MSSEDTTAEKKVHQCTEDHDHKHDHEHGHDHKHEHKHDHDKCNSPHEHDSDSGDDVDDGKKGNRGEKKFKKAMNKLGMKPISGINRVTIRKGKNLLLYIDNPEILKSPGVDNSYIM